MRTKFFLFYFVTVAFSLKTFSQNSQWQVSSDSGEINNLSFEVQRKNEVKFNLAYILFAMPEVTYENCISEGIGLGASLTFSLNHDEYSFNYGVTPFMRVYFGADYASGFFVEINSMLFSYNNAHDEVVSGQNTKAAADNRMGFGVGGAIGTKIVSSRKWVCDLYLGVIRTNTDFGAQPRIGVNIGPRI